MMHKASMGFNNPQTLYFICDREPTTSSIDPILLCWDGNYAGFIIQCPTEHSCMSLSFSFHVKKCPFCCVGMETMMASLFSAPQNTVVYHSLSHFHATKFPFLPEGMHSEIIAVFN